MAAQRTSEQSAKAGIGLLLNKTNRAGDTFNASEVIQNTLFNIVDYGESHKNKKKRVRYKTPTYIKSYQFRVFNDETKQYQYYGDEKHILRIETLHKLYSMIYGYCNINLFEQFERKDIDGLTIWGEDKQAEIANTWNLPLKDRVKLHLRLLRYLRKGFSVRESLERVRNENTL